MKANGWNKSQAMTAFTLGLHDQDLTVLEALGKEVTNEQLLEALETRYGEAHLEHVFRVQLKDRVKRSSNENLQHRALEVEKLIRKAYQSVPALIDGKLVQAFINGIRNLEVRAAVRLSHHGTLKDALAPMHWRWKLCGRIIVPIASGRLQRLQFAIVIKAIALGATAVGKGSTFDPVALSQLQKGKIAGLQRVVRLTAPPISSRETSNSQNCGSGAG